MDFWGLFPYLAVCGWLAWFALFNGGQIGGFYSSCLVLLALAGLRHQVGFDYQAYIDIFTGENETVLEPLSLALMELARAVNSPQVFFFSAALVVIVPVAVVFWLRTRNASLALLMFFCLPYFFLTSLSIVRQWMAIAIVFSAFMLLGERQWLMRCVLVVFASQFHYSALVMLPTAMLHGWLNRPFPWYVYLGVALIPSGLVALAPDLIVELAPKYAAYVTEGDHGRKVVALYALLCATGYWFGARHAATFPWRLFNYFFAGAATLASMVFLSEAAMRIGYYFLVFAIPLAVDVVERMAVPVPVPVRLTVIAVLAALLATQLYFGAKNPDQDPYLPYQTVFQSF